MHRTPEHSVGSLIQCDPQSTLTFQCSFKIPIKFGVNQAKSLFSQRTMLAIKIAAASQMSYKYMNLKVIENVNNSQLLQTLSPRILQYG
jgi:hypothetical protein